jgi:hypothetical protein
MQTLKRTWNENHDKKQSVATGTALKLNLNESAENSQRASGAARMARNAINNTANLKLV